MSTRSNVRIRGEQRRSQLVGPRSLTMTLEGMDVLNGLNTFHGSSRFEVGVLLGDASASGLTVERPLRL